MNKLTYFTNNNGTMEIAQQVPDGAVYIHTFHDNNDFLDNSKDITIPSGDMVMLVNYYQYVIENNIQNNFINPNGRNHE